MLWSENSGVRRRCGLPLILCLVLALTMAGCGKKTPRRKVAQVKIGTVETGEASWYGHPYHGRRAANGEIYDMEKMTAAHRTLPFETWVRVRNLTNDKEIQVRITDRGPFVGDRMLDLSHAAARDIGLIGPGVARVRLIVIPPPASSPASIEAPVPVSLELFAVQVGAFRNQEAAESLRVSMQQRYGTARLVYREGNPSVWRVLVGQTPNREAGAALADEVRKTQSAAFVVRLDESPSQSPVLP